MTQLLLPLPSRPPEPVSVCLLTVDVSGSTQLARTLPLDHYMALMTEFVQVMILSFEARGGQVLQHQGDAVLAYWTAPETAQACAAALDAHDRAARLGLAGMLGVALRVRVGLAVGDVITGVVGGQHSAYGLPVNYARRLCDAARPGETLACPEVAPLVGRAVGVEVHRPLHLPGFGPDCRTFRLTLQNTAPDSRPLPLSI